MRVALTGGIGTGKSYCLDRFAALGAPVINADELARDAVALSTPGLEAVTRRFGARVLALDGSLDRRALAQLVFHDAVARRDLEAIVHPIVYARLQAWFAALTADAAPNRTVAIADIPLLFETNRQADFDRVVVAACDPAIQIERVIARGRESAADARARIAAQLPISQKRARADYVIDTGGTFADTDRQVEAVWNQLRA